MGSKDVQMADAEVAAAEAAASEAQSLVAQLEEAVASGDESVTAEQIAAQESLGRFARLRAEFTRRKAVQAREAAVVKATRDLRADILTRAPENGEEMVRLLHAVEDAARAFEMAANAHDATVREWCTGLAELHVPRTGAPSGDHEGLGWSAAGDVLVDSAFVQAVDAKNMLRLIFNTYENGGLLPNPQPEMPAHAYAKLANIGKAQV